MRKIVDEKTINEKYLVPTGQFSRAQGHPFSHNEHWIVAYDGHNRFDSKQNVRVGFNPYMRTFDAIRYYDSTSPDTKFVKYFVDLCYVKGEREYRTPDHDQLKWCDKVRELSETTNNGQPIAFDDLRSPWKGTIRNMSPNRLTQSNPGPIRVFYSDTYGENMTTDPSTCGRNMNGVGCIKQFVNVGEVADCGADLFLPTKDWGVESTHSPN